MTMKPALLTATACAVLLLSGCGKKAGDNANGGPKTMEQAKEEAAKLDRPKPGQYSQTMTITKFELPGAPPEVAKQLSEGMQKAQEHSFCLTEEMAAKGFRDMFDKIGKDGECKYNRFDVAGGKIDALIECQNAHEGKGTIAMSGTVSPEGSDVNVTLDQTGGQNAKIAMHVVSKRTGDCTGNEKVLGK